MFGKQAFLDAIGHDLSRLHWHEVREDGVYVRNPSTEDARLGLTDRVVRHPLGDFDKPALPFPFTVEQFIAFDETVGLAWETSNDSLEQLRAAAPRSYELMRAALIAAIERERSHWMSRELWALWEAAYLLNGSFPKGDERHFFANVTRGRQDQPEARTYRLLKDATDTGSLGFIRADAEDTKMRRRVRPADALEWGRRQGMPVPTALTPPAVPAAAADAETVQPEPGPAGRVEPKQRWVAQEEIILNTLRALNYQPHALPKPEPWKPGVKAEVRAAIGRNGMWAQGRVFDKAWERLRDRGDIADKA